MKEDLSNKKPKDLFELIVQQNHLAHSKEGDELKSACNLCSEAIEEIVKRKYGKISMTFKKMFDRGTEFNCEECVDSYQYALARLQNDQEAIKSIEEKYDIPRTGTAIIRDGLIYIDPNVKAPM